jgi:hypothetical protein
MSQIHAKTDKLALVAVSVKDGKMRVTSQSWDDPLVLLADHSLVLAGTSRSTVIPPRMFGQAPGRGSHLPVSDPLPTRSAIGFSA